MLRILSLWRAQKAQVLRLYEAGKETRSPEETAEAFETQRFPTGSGATGACNRRIESAETRFPPRPSQNKRSAKGY